MTLASGSRVALRYCREAVRGVTPAGITTPATNLSAAANGGAAGRSKFVRSAGSFVTDGYCYGQYVKSAGFSNTVNNGTWRVRSVSATELVVDDASDVIVDETAATANTTKILMNTLLSPSKRIQYFTR